LTTLPADAGRLRQRLEWAAKTFAGEAERADADYLFVLENDQHEAIGICALAGAVGLREPWYNYRLGPVCRGLEKTSGSISSCRRCSSVTT
jgi:Arginine/ornithine N-succinyltransferase beta subunit